MALPKQLIQEQKRKLESERAGLKKQLAAIEGGTRSTMTTAKARFPSYGNKDDENAAEVAQYTDNLSLESTLRSAYDDVEAALRRVALGTYGICKYCGKEIEEPRLKVRPSSSSCVKCKQRLKSGK